MLSTIVWNIQPEIFPDSFLPIRWYGLMFALAFLLGYEVFKKLLKRDGAPNKWLDNALYFTMIGTIVGARLGHVFFYDWAYYKEHLAQIPQVWRGGLASHGAAIGIIFAIYLYSKYITKKPVLWALDRVVVTVALAGVFIRLGNFFNSEIIGTPTDSAFLGVIFTRIDDVPRHAAQLYEATAYLAIFIFMYYSAFKKQWTNFKGRLFGFFLISIFTARFFLEFFKENQVAFEEGLTLNMGQYLSIPCVLAGLYFFITSYTSNAKQQNP